MGTIVKTYEEWGFFKKELTPDEEYQKQKKQAQVQKNKVKPDNAPIGKTDEEEEDEEGTTKMRKDELQMDPYGEEFWEPYGEDRTPRPSC